MNILMDDAAVAEYVRGTARVYSLALGEEELEPMSVAVADLLRHAAKLAPDNAYPVPNGTVDGDSTVAPA
jgi:hypothetical protein